MKLHAYNNTKHNIKLINFYNIFFNFFLLRTATKLI